MVKHSPMTSVKHVSVARLSFLSLFCWRFWLVSDQRFICDYTRMCNISMQKFKATISLVFSCQLELITRLLHYYQLWLYQWHIYHIRSAWVGACNSHTKPMSRHFYKMTYIFSILFLSWNKAVPVQRRNDVKLVSCDRSWRSHGSLIPGKFDLTINQFIKTPWQECSVVPYFYLSATDQIQKLHQTSLNKHTKYKSKDHIANIWRLLHHLRIYFWKKQRTVLFPRFKSFVGSF